MDQLSRLLEVTDSDPELQRWVLSGMRESSVLKAARNELILQVLSELSGSDWKRCDDLLALCEARDPRVGELLELEPYVGIPQLRQLLRIAKKRFRDTDDTS